MGEITKELVSLAMTALEMAADSIEKTGVPLQAFVVVEKDGQRVLHHVEAKEFATQPIAAWQFAGSQTDADRVAMAVDGYVTVDGEVSTGIVVEVADVGSGESHYVGVQYETHGLLKKTGNVKDHKPALMGKGDGFPQLA